MDGVYALPKVNIPCHMLKATWRPTCLLKSLIRNLLKRLMKNIIILFLEDNHLRKRKLSPKVVVPQHIICYGVSLRGELSFSSLQHTSNNADCLGLKDLDSNCLHLFFPLLSIFHFN